MALRKILQFPNPALKEPAAPVANIDADVATLIDDMAETMYAAPGVGLAATQVDVHLRVIIIDVSEDQRDLKVFVNPQIRQRRGTSEREEGCLSVPGVYDKVNRSEWIRVHALGRDGQPFELEADGLLSVCIQHEMDHLEGKVFVEYLSPLKQSRIKAKMRKRAKQAA